MKVKFTVVKGCGDITEGKIYESNYIEGDIIVFQGDTRSGQIHKKYCKIIPDTPPIEVGSEWLSKKRGVNKVKYVGDVIVLENSQGKEFSIKTEYFHKSYSPKPKTVTMYFYKLGNQLCACEVEPASTPVLFTREIEV